LFIITISVPSGKRGIIIPILKILQILPITPEIDLRIKINDLRIDKDRFLNSDTYNSKLDTGNCKLETRGDS